MDEKMAVAHDYIRATLFCVIMLISGLSACITIICKRTCIGPIPSTSQRAFTHVFTLVISKIRSGSSFKSQKKLAIHLHRSK